MPAHANTHESSSRLVKPHLVRHVIHEAVMYPAHGPREETPEYAATHHQMVVVEDRPCFICGVRNSTLSSPAENPCGASAMETHHVYVEWALINAVDVEKLNAYFGKQLDAAGWAAELEHGEAYLLVLCDIHHRHKEAGIHELTYPIWIAQKFVRDDYALFPVSSSSSA